MAFWIDAIHGLKNCREQSNFVIVCTGKAVQAVQFMQHVLLKMQESAVMAKTLREIILGI